MSSPDEPQTDLNFSNLISTLPKQKDILFTDLILYNGFWFGPPYLRFALDAQIHFKPFPSDFILVTLPKSGTTWLKSLLFTLIHRNSHHPITSPNHPLSSHPPHRLVPFLELHVSDINQPIPEHSDLLSPRIFASHLPIALLPPSIPPSGAKIVYMCRDPRDCLISLWQFGNKIRIRGGGDIDLVELGEAVDLFCEGATTCGPYWEHVLGYWRASVERPEELMFLKYEEVMREPVVWVRRIGEFLGFGFSEEEVEGGVVEMIVEMCSFDRLKDLEVNKSGEFFGSIGIENKAFFRRGVVGDWANYLTPVMAEKMVKVIGEKTRGSGLVLCD